MAHGTLVVASQKFIAQDLKSTLDLKPLEINDRINSGKKHLKYRNYYQTNEENLPNKNTPSSPKNYQPKSKNRVTRVVI